MPALVSNHAHSAVTARTLKREKTSAPPNIMECHFQALFSVMCILETAIAHGSIQRRLDPKAWKKYQRGRHARRMAEI